MFNQSIIVMTKFKAQEIHCPSPPWNNQFSKILTGFLLLHKKKIMSPLVASFNICLDIRYYKALTFPCLNVIHISKCA